jgi:hypothetical protein
LRYSYFCSGVLLGAAAVFLTGCVSTQVRKGADRLAAFTHQVSEEGADFVRSRTILAQARRANIAMLQVNAVEIENSTNRDVEVWRLAGETGKRRVELFEGIRSYANTAASRTAELADLRKRHDDSIVAAKSAVDLRQAELAKVSKALANLGQEPNLDSEVKFFVTYFKEVNAGIEKAKGDADQQVKAAEAAAKNAVPRNEGVPRAKGTP